MSGRPGDDPGGVAKGAKNAKHEGKTTKKDALWVCRGCCCGTRAKHPGVDHKGLERQTRHGAAAAGARYEVTTSLGPCGQGNIVVVRADGLTRWFRRMNDEVSTAALLDHLAATGTVTALPEVLDRHVMRGRDGRKP